MTEHTIPPSVRAAEEQATHDTEKVIEMAGKKRAIIKTGRDSRDNRDTLERKASRASGASMVSETAEANAVPRFELREESSKDGPPGVYRIEQPCDKKGNVLPEVSYWLSSPLYISADTRNADNDEWGRLLEWRDKDGKVHRWPMPMGILAGDLAALMGELLNSGLLIATHPARRRLLADYIQGANPARKVRCVSRTGWHGKAFVFPDETIGPTDHEPVIYQSSTLDRANLSSAGSLEGWRTDVAARCVGNSRLVLSLCMAFAPAALEWLGIPEGGGLNHRGPSSGGKTTALRVTASAYGPPSYMQTWRATDNGLEGVAAMHSDMCPVLDELGELGGQYAGSAAYALANGRGKARARRDGSLRVPARWRVLFLSAGEVSLGDLVTQSGGKVRAGQEVRVIDVPADAGAGMGIFERVPEGMDAATFADTLRDAAATHHGHAFRAFVGHLVANPEHAKVELRRVRDNAMLALLPAGASGQVRRVAEKFAVMASAGELATRAGLTGWPEGEATAAAKVCFAAWLTARGGAGEAEPAAMLEAVRMYLDLHGESRFTVWTAPGDPLGDVSKTINRAGFRKRTADGEVFYIFPEVFKNEICKGFHAAEVEGVLLARKALVPDAEGCHTRSERLPIGKKRVYVITPALWEDA